MSGATLYGVGVGPGDPELVTLKALRVIRAAPVLAYPQLGPMPSFARAIVAPHLTGGSRREIAVRVPLAPAEATAAAYDAAASEIAAELDGGTDVAVLCEGDPFLYGSFIALWSRLRDRFECEIIPGVSSLMAAPARLGHPLATGAECVAVVPGTLDDAALESRIAAADSVAILKVGRHLARLRALIERLGLIGQAHYIERATLEAERAMPLADLGEADAPYFSMILIARRPGAAA